MLPFYNNILYHFINDHIQFSPNAILYLLESSNDFDWNAHKAYYSIQQLDHFSLFALNKILMRSQFMPITLQSILFFLFHIKGIHVEAYFHLQACLGHIFCTFLCSTSVSRFPLFTLYNPGCFRSIFFV